MPPIADTDARSALAEFLLYRPAQAGVGVM
jgi:hypothetical protein